MAGSSLITYMDKKKKLTEETNKSELEVAKSVAFHDDQQNNVCKGGELHMCNYCNYTTSKRHLLVRHMKFDHTEEKPYVCSICERGFKAKKYLKVHVNTHTHTPQM